jgi:tetratricopeptide (TPR) repeat protein
MGGLYLLGTLFTVWMASDAVRRGRSQSWLWIMVFFNPLGAVFYFFTEYNEGGLAFRWPGQHLRRVTAADLRHAEAEVHRLGNAASWLQYASALRARKQYAKSVEAARNAVARDAANVDGQYELARALFDAKRPGEAVEPLEQVLARDRSFDRENALYLLSQAQLARNEPQAARRSLEELGERSSRPEYLYALALQQGRDGDREAAGRTLQRIIHEAEIVPAYLQREFRPWVRKARSGLRKLWY